MPVYLENTAGGDHAVARRFDALAKLREAVGAAKTDVDIGFCFDTCHAHAAGDELDDAVERAIAITGGIDLMHLNDSRDPPGTEADRHANIGAGTMDLDVLQHMIREAGAPSVVETPREPVESLRADVEFVRESLAWRGTRGWSSAGCAPSMTVPMEALLAVHADDIVMFDVPDEGARSIDAYRETWPPFFEWQRRGRASRSI